jgi:CRISPR system Cascade subunit CasC
MKMDFFTAVEELKDLAREQGVEQGAGAGMMGFSEFNSACHYRYANLDVEQLLTNLQGDKELARKAVEAFIRASIVAIPSGKQNSMATPTPPSFILAVVRDSGLWSLANAFVRPVQPKGEKDLVKLSVQRLDAHWGNLVRGFGSKDANKDPIKARPAFVLDEAAAEPQERSCLSALKDQQVSSINDLITKVMETVSFKTDGAQT